MQCTHLLVGMGWGASPSTLRTSALALVYAPAEYCAPTWSRSRHTSLLDVSLNCTLRIITGCLQPTPVEQLPVLAGIPPAELRRWALSLALACRAMDPDHLLHHTITREETQPRLKSWRPFATSGKDLLSTTLPNETKTHWIARMWSVEWQPSTSRLREYITSPSRSSPGSDIPRQACVKFNRLRTKVGRFNANMCRWGLSKSPACDCGADFKSYHHGVPSILSTKWSPWLKGSRMGHSVVSLWCVTLLINARFRFFFFHFRISNC